MKRVALAALFAAATIPAAADTTARQRYCAHSRDPLYFLNLAWNPQNHLAFRNGGGRWKVGLCWWHSQFQRNALYLAVFHPERPKPSRAEAWWIIDRLRWAARIVEIPGYRNLAEFSAAHEEQIERTLSDWQTYDATIGFSWVEGLRGPARLPAAEMRRTMEALHDRVTNVEKMVFLRLQLPGVASHAFLVIESQRRSDGYRLRYLDSNRPGRVGSLDYRYGDEVLTTPGYGDFAPYPAKSSHFQKDEGARAAYCR